MQDKFVIEVTADNFQAAVVENSQKVPVLLDFWAPWCQPCKSLIPTLQQITEEFNGNLILAKINTEDNPELGSHFQIRSIPTVMLVKDGAVLDQFNGALPKSQILEFLKKHNIVNQIDAILAELEELSIAEDFTHLAEVASAALEIYPDNLPIKMHLAKSLIRLHKLEEAKNLLDSFASEDKSSAQFKGLYASLSFDSQALSEAQIQTLQTKAQTGDLESLYDLGSFYLAQANYEQALDYLLQILKKDKNFKDGAANKNFLDTLAILGSSNPVAIKFRRQLFTLLY